MYFTPVRRSAGRGVGDPYERQSGPSLPRNPGDCHLREQFRGVKGTPEASRGAHQALGGTLRTGGRRLLLDDRQDRGAGGEHEPAIPG